MVRWKPARWRAPVYLPAVEGGRSVVNRHRSLESRRAERNKSRYVPEEQWAPLGLMGAAELGLETKETQDPGTLADVGLAGWLAGPRAKGAARVRAI